MGDRGQPTRMLAAKYGGYLTFGSLGGGKESAPGQPTLRQLRQMYRLPQLTPDCQVTPSPLDSPCHAGARMHPVVVYVSCIETLCCRMRRLYPPSVCCTTVMPTCDAVAAI